MVIMRYVSITTFAILFMLSPRHSPAQSQQALALADEKSDLRLEIKAEGSAFRVSDQVNVRVDLRNAKDVPVRVSWGRPAEPFFHFVVVRLENSGLSVPIGLTQTGKEITAHVRMDGRRSRMMPVGESSNVTFDIGSWYSWTPGTYKIACYYDMPTSDRYDSPILRYSSNELTLTVAQ